MIIPDVNGLIQTSLLLNLNFNFEDRIINNKRDIISNQIFSNIVKRDEEKDEYQKMLLSFNNFILYSSTYN